MSGDIWVSMIGLMPVSGESLARGDAAVVWVVAKARTREEFFRLISGCVAREGFIIISEEETGVVTDPAAEDFAFDMVDVAEMLHREPPGAIFFDEYQWYPMDAEE